MSDLNKLMNDLGKEKLFISKLIENDFIFKINNPLISSIIKFGVYPNLLFIYVVLSMFNELDISFFSGLVFGTLGLNIGPFLIWYYDQRVLPTFFSKMQELVEDKKELHKIIKKYMNFFHRGYKFPLVLGMFLLLFAFFKSTQMYRIGGVTGVTDPLLWAYFIDAVLLGIYIGVGFTGVLTSILLIRKISELDLKIDPLHPDNLGGLSSIGYFAIRTTLLFSVGSLYLPIAIQTGIVAYPLTIVYMVLIALSFIYPTYKIHKKANKIRDQILEDLRRKYKDVKSEVPQIIDESEDSKKDKLKMELELQRIRQEYLDYNDMRLYPMEINIFVRLFSSIILPLIFTLLQIYNEYLMELFF